MSLWGWITGAVGSIYNAGGQVTRTIRSTAVNGPSRQVSNITSGVTSFSRSLSRSVSPISNIYNAGRSTMQTIRSTAIKGPSQNLKQSIQSISKISRSNPIGQMGSQTMRQVKNLTKTGKIQQAQPKRNIQQTNNIPSFQDAAGAAFSKIPGVMAISAGVGAASKMMTTNTSKPPSQQPVKSQVQKRNNDYLGTNLRISAPKNLININNIGSLPPINAKLPKSSSSAANNPPKYKASDYSGFSRSAGELGVKTAEISSILGSEKTPYIGIPGKPVETAIQKSVIRVSGGIASLGLFVPPTIESMAKIGIEKGPIALGGAVAGATAAGVSAQAQSFIEHPKTSALDLAVGGIMFAGASKGLSYSPVKPAKFTAEFPAGPKYTSYGLRRSSGPTDSYLSILGFSKKSGNLVPDSIFMRSPKLDLAKTIPKGKEYTPYNPFESKIMVRSVGSEAPKIDLAMKVRRTTHKAHLNLDEVKPVVKAVIEEHQIPNPAKVTEAIVKKFKADEIELKGSTIQYGVGKQINKPGLNRVPRDFDLHVADTAKFEAEMTKMINSYAGKEVVKIGKGNEGKGIYTLKGEKLFDVHAKDIPSDYARQSGDYIAYGLREEPLHKTSDGTFVTTLSEQASRKLEGGMQIRGTPESMHTPTSPVVSGRVLPKHQGRIKDIGDYYMAEKLSIETLKLSPRRKISAGKADKNLESWLDQWGEEISSRVRTDYNLLEQSGDLKMPLADYAAPLHYNPGSPMPRPPGIPPLSVMQQSTPQYDSPISAAAGKSSKSIDSMLKGYGGRSSRNLEYSAEVNDYSTPSYPKNPVKTPKKQQSNYGYPVTYTPQKPTKTNYPQEPSYNIPEKTTHITSYDLPGKIPNKTPEITSYDFPGQTPQDIPNIIPYDFPGNIPDYKPEIYDTPKNYQDITRISTVTITTPELISIPELTPVKEKPIKTKPKKFKPPEIDPKPFDDWMIHNPVPDVEFVFGGIIDGGKQSQSKSKSGKSKKSGKAKAERKDNKKYYELF